MKIAVHVFDGISLFHTTAPVKVFGEVARLRLADDWDVELWSAEGGTVRTAEGFELAPVGDPTTAQDADLLVFPSWHEDLCPVTLFVAPNLQGNGVAGLSGPARLLPPVIDDPGGVVTGPR